MIIGSKYRAFNYNGFKFIITEYSGFYDDKDVTVNLSMKYRKKPVEIEARQLDHTQKSQRNIADWCGGIIEEHLPGVHIPTPEGIMYAQVGDYVIKGVKGEFYPCKPDIFEMTYDKV